MLSILLDIEWLLSTLFDASLLTFEPPETAAPFCLLSRFGPSDAPGLIADVATGKADQGRPAAARAAPSRLPHS
jgi:hypothetical protein